MTIDAGVTSNVFREGHRIRVEISSSNFPRFDRNPNTGVPVADETEMRKARQTVYHDHDRYSYVLLPVVPPARELTSGKQDALCSKENVRIGRGSQVVRQGSAKPLFVGSIPTRTSNGSTLKPLTI